MKQILPSLMKEYHRLMEIEQNYEKWKEQNPESNPWEYYGQRVSKARFERIGVLIRQTMIDYERSIKYWQ